MLPILVRGQSVYQTVSTSPSRAFFATSVSSFNLNRSQFVRNLFGTGSQRKDDRYGNLRQSSCCAVQRVGGNVVVLQRVSGKDRHGSMTIPHCLPLDSDNEHLWKSFLIQICFFDCWIRFEAIFIRGFLGIALENFNEICRGKFLKRLYVY